MSTVRPTRLAASWMGSRMSGGKVSNAAFETTVPRPHAAEAAIRATNGERRSIG